MHSYPYWQGYENPPRCECHECTQARYRMSNPFFGSCLAGLGASILGQAQGLGSGLLDQKLGATSTEEQEQSKCLK